MDAAGLFAPIVLSAQELQPRAYLPALVRIPVGCYLIRAYRLRMAMYKQMFHRSRWVQRWTCLEDPAKSWRFCLMQ